MSEWISVKERLPEPYRLVLVAREFEGVGIELHLSKGEWAADNIYNKKYRPVTHWMSLPEPPGVTDTNVGGKGEG